MQPTDIIVYLTAGAGHAIEYVGNGMVLESGGNAMDIKEISSAASPGSNVGLYTATFNDEKYEEDGTYNLYSINDYFCKDNSAYNVAKKDQDGNYVYKEILIIRPIYFMVEEDNGKLTDVVKSEFSIAPSALSRIRYPGMEIDRTVSLTPYGTAFINEPVTYRIRISNHTQSVYQGLQGERVA